MEGRGVMKVKLPNFRGVLENKSENESGSSTSSISIHPIRHKRSNDAKFGEGRSRFDRLGNPILRNNERQELMLRRGGLGENIVSRDMCGGIGIQSSRTRSTLSRYLNKDFAEIPT